MPGDRPEPRKNRGQPFTVRTLALMVLLAAGGAGARCSEGKDHVGSRSCEVIEKATGDPSTHDVCSRCQGRACGDGGCEISPLRAGGSGHPGLSGGRGLFVVPGHPVRTAYGARFSSAPPTPTIADGSSSSSSENIATISDDELISVPLVHDDGVIHVWVTGEEHVWEFRHLHPDDRSPRVAHLHDENRRFSFTGVIASPNHDGMTAMQVEEEIDQAEATGCSRRGQRTPYHRHQDPAPGSGCHLSLGLERELVPCTVAAAVS